MRTIRRTATLKRDYKRERRGRRGKTVDAELSEIVAMLIADQRLLRRYRDHALAREWKDHRDCHVRPDIILIYRKPDAEHLDLVHLGSHSKLGL